ncbi:SDR family NAD(P)-dependent oxidoreductase [Streptomyces sp. TS71-3]|uniref:SDR family NAD(P)-dependent oxidoreductase n=1 Tax=Streptomyces sp. TS71-3 TaxID=2733862 RepID=UPI001B0E13C1|nr:SDR family NAD(P)-dependent oxidoreductase [Streptomyces sp. TS71-3]GHJ35041.1 oxidoreductase [Streptomyces sp. TS71-3]
MTTGSTPLTDRVTTPFGAESTAAEVLEGIDLGGRRAVVTGASSGVGVETARALAAAGAEVTLAVRNTQAGEATAADITASTGNPRIHVAPLDLADLASVTAFTSGWQGPLHILINNAGVMYTPETRTPQGWELQFATNHLGHFTLATGLYPALAAAGGSRVVSLSSRGHQSGPVVFDDIHFDRRPYDKRLAYGQSKTANSLFAVEAHRRWTDDGITVNAVHPGAVLGTGLARHISQEELDAASSSVPYTFKDVRQGAATSVLTATWPALDGVGGRYFEDCNQAVRHEDGMVGGVCDHALDPEAAQRLWRVSVDMIG